MPLIIDDDILQEANLTEAAARIEIACRLYDSGRLSLAVASRLAGLEASAFHDALSTRFISLNKADESGLDEQYAAGYARFREDPAELAPLLPHMESPDKGWT